MDRRATIQRALNAARNAASAAKAAEGALNAEYAREHGKLKGIESHANAAIAGILIEEAQPALDALAEHTRAHAAAVEAMAQVSTLVGDIARSADLDIARPAFVELEEFNAKLAAAMSRPAPDRDAAAASRLAWRKLVADLAVDAKAELEAVS